MIKTPFESQDQVRYSTQPTLSTISTLLSATLSPVENGQTLQQFWSPLYSIKGKQEMIIKHSNKDINQSVQQHKATCHPNGQFQNLHWSSLLQLLTASHIM